ncbi:hypothetical protein KPC83_02950 [Collinsella sp. zg1085]|uniref:hypothetical protein n=1 Tax=Collinsella sp. zg1085 TaxID=2844380 RepID=UPI001C0D896C|nr:hypothetical protein [Collinsella sp. zg1085]QWT18103.1 hypothetical protein KPC83_02950 [Collinsella sp. zg1085]
MEQLGDNQVDKEQKGTDKEPNYKALYEEAKANARKWEARAKANKDAQAELESTRAASKTDAERIAALEERLSAKERAEARRTLADEVAKAKHVPAQLLVGDTREAMEAWADEMLQAFKQKPAAKLDAPGTFDRASTNSSPATDFSKFMNDAMK